VRALVTGGTGFAGRHLVAHLRACGDEVVAVGRAAADLLDADAARRAVMDAAPDAVYHLAARAHVGRSWDDPAGTVADNLAMAQHLLEAVRVAAPDAAVVVVSSGEVYGPPGVLPVDEAAPLRPQSPYAVSKAAADLLAGMYADAHGLRVVRARAFSHAGPGQEPVYAVSAFARQVADGVREVRTGNPATRRDLTDVRDVVRAYRLLALRGEPGQAYNVCSERAVSTAELVERLGAVAVADPALVRAHEVPELRGSAAKLRAATGWAPEVPLEVTLRDTLDYWRAAAASGASRAAR
jgi:GDP-4-dehydro-6-deoxy-D-mannose reductase